VGVVVMVAVVKVAVVVVGHMVVVDVVDVVVVVVVVSHVAGNRALGGVFVLLHGSLSLQVARWPGGGSPVFRHNHDGEDEQHHDGADTHPDPHPAAP